MYISIFWESLVTTNYFVIFPLWLYEESKTWPQYLHCSRLAQSIDWNANSVNFNQIPGNEVLGNVCLNILNQHFVFLLLTNLWCLHLLYLSLFSPSCLLTYCFQLLMANFIAAHCLFVLLFCTLHNNYVVSFIMHIN